MKRECEKCKEAMVLLDITKGVNHLKIQNIKKYGCPKCNHVTYVDEDGQSFS